MGAIGAKYAGSFIDRHIDPEKVDYLADRYNFADTWDPGHLEGLRGWWAADRLPGLKGGGAVAAWPDLSSFGNNAAQATGAKQPTYRDAPSASMNRKPVVDEDGVDDVLLVPDAASLDLTTEMMIAVAVRPDGGQRGFPVNKNRFTSSSDNAGYRTEIEATNTTRFGLFDNDADQDASTNTQLFLGQPNVWSVALYNSVGYIYQQGQLYTAQALLDAAAANVYPLLLGARDDTNSGTENVFYKGDYGEVVVGAKAPDRSIQRLLDWYLGRKWGRRVNSP